MVHDEIIQTSKGKETKYNHYGKEFCHKKTSELKRHLNFKHSDIIIDKYTK